jgi:peptide-methionine (S)-S-oxide reductase
VCAEPDSCPPPRSRSLQGFLRMYISNQFPLRSRAGLLARVSHFFRLSSIVLVDVISIAGATFPAPTIDEISHASKPETAVLAGGCFWGMEAVFEHVKGILGDVSGYSGGASSTAHSDLVETGRTGHAESVQITYDPSQITYGQLLKVFFAIAHNPTESNRQGPDRGTQYRSVIFYADDEQKHVAEIYIRQLNAVRAFNHKIVTQVVPPAGFYPAEDFFQHYCELHPTNAYVVQNDLPKLEALKARYPDLYR